MAKILLLSPPYVELYGDLKKAAGRYFPLGLGYIASYLMKYGGHEVQLYEPEAQGLTMHRIQEVVREFQPDIVGITCSTANFTRAIEMAQLCRNNSRAKIIIGGVHVSAIPEYVMSEYADWIDCVVVGEGEITMLELVEAYQRNSDIGDIEGIVYNKKDKIVRNACRPYIEDLDSIPFPARHLIPQHLFFPNMHNARYRNCLTILTSRGCPFNCSFCAARIVSGTRYRMHSAEYVLEEMQMLKKDYNARQLLITDDTFTINHPRLEKICKGMIDKKLNLKWFCFAQVTTVNREMLSLMKKAGCYSIGFGLESSDEEILRKMGKPISPARSKETVKIANQIGLKTQAFYILGSSGETRTQMAETIKFSQEVDSTLAFYNMLVPFPGTKDFDFYFSSVPLKSINWEKFVAIGEDCVLKNAEVSGQEIENLISKANIKYYANPRKIINLLFHIRTLYEFKNYLMGGIALFRQLAKWSREKSDTNDSNIVAYEKESCNICGSDDYTIVYHSNVGLTNPSIEDYTSTANKYSVYNNIVKCKKCGLVYMNPRDVGVIELYKDVVDNAYLETWPERAETFNDHLKVIAKYKPDGMLLDIGCYAGIFLDEAQKRGYQVAGIEASTWASNYAREKTGATIINASCNEKQFFATGEFDVVTLWDVVEHLDNPSLCFSNIYNYLKREGIVVVTTHDIGSVFARIMGKRYPWLMRFHLYHFTPKTLSALLLKNGFEVVHTEFYSKKFSLSYLLSRVGIKARGALFRRIVLPVNTGDMFMLIAKKII
ncbi:B12-binding domain-containing radical SAM protein [Thiovibrio frasassiensis]|uniref:Cobalamin-dependent protein n=1 Tax=Thiovibrio frasassiensis TaxID=2984131 RepID=A0A9X4RMC8_9BACT|nr:radical SAM protein [Thiovibrio frasassiensis]MDG4476048.1 cobalamin-dependent protein [Thiovibrio frasassiensis]